MDANSAVQQAPPAASTGMEHGEEVLAELDEPPDELRWSPTRVKFGYVRTHPSMQRRESLLTRQLHSETEHTDEEHTLPGRAMSTQSTQSTQSATSMTELTSDDGHSVPSPMVSPPLAPTRGHIVVPVHEKVLEQRLKIVGQDDAVAPVPKEASQEQNVEANLGRKRCISFACRGKQETKPAPPPTSQPAEAEVAAPPKRKCMLKFACPTKMIAPKPAEKTQSKRAVSPPLPIRRSASKTKHRGSDSTVTHASPKSVRKEPTAAIVSDQVSLASTRRYSVDSDVDDGNEATRFHEFATSEDEPEAWCQESTCYRTRLTVDDTLKKENIIRKTCEEVEEEVLEEEDENEEEDLREELDAVAEDDEDAIDHDESDEGFHSDDEGGFASSDSEHDDDSDYEWWKPGGRSTAATSVDQLDRLAIVNSQHIEPSSSVNSASSSHLSPRSSRLTLRKTSSKSNHTQAISINRPPSPELPDSTDFVCGTLDEDRPMEQAYINRKKAKDAAKHPARPQDIDPSFPTSGPEMDEEDDDDVDEVPSSDEDDMMHGALEMHDFSPKKFSPPHQRGRTSMNRSPPPPQRHHHSPAPKRVSVARSPPPPKRVSVARSPPPPKRARSPLPRKLFGSSPRRAKSPAPLKRMTSPANSPDDHTAPISTATLGLAGRPQPTHTASLPRNGPITLNRLAHWGDQEEDVIDAGIATEVPKRGAIDIVKGVELKRQRRKEKLRQKMCAKNAQKGEKAHKVKPGKGAERMREVGLQLQQYRGKAEHILSL